MGEFDNILDQADHVALLLDTCDIQLESKLSG